MDAGRLQWRKGREGDRPEVSGGVADALEDGLCDAVCAHVIDVVGRHEFEPNLRVVGEVTKVGEAGADACVD